MQSWTYRHVHLTCGHVICGNFVWDTLEMSHKMCVSILSVYLCIPLKLEDIDARSAHLCIMSSFTYSKRTIITYLGPVWPQKYFWKKFERNLRSGVWSYNMVNLFDKYPKLRNTRKKLVFEPSSNICKF